MGKKDEPVMNVTTIWANKALRKYDEFYFFGLAQISRKMMRIGMWDKDYWYQCEENEDCDEDKTCCADIGLAYDGQEKKAKRCMKNSIVKDGIKGKLGEQYSSWTRCANQNTTRNGGLIKRVTNWFNSVS